MLFTALSALLIGLAIGVPVAMTLGVAATLALFDTDVPLTLIAHRMYAGLDSFTIMAIPFFILAGMLMDAGGISRRIVDFAMALVGWITGSLLLVAVVAATALAAMSGSGSADTAAVSSVLAPELRKRNYDLDFAAGIIAAAGTLAQIIPPSIMMVLIAVTNNLSTGAMLLSGVIPGLLTVPGLLLICYLHARKGGPQYRDVLPFDTGRLLRSFWTAIPAFGMAVIIVGGIMGGIVTPTEAAALAAGYALLIGMFVYGDLRLRDIPGVFMRATAFSASILLLIATATVLNWIFANAEVPRLLTTWLKSLVDGPIGYLLLINLMLMIFGMFFESFAMILILSPVLVPIAVSFGIEPHHFALVVVYNLCIGMITPPFAGTLFVAATVFQRPIWEVSKRVFAPWLVMTIVLLLITFIPELGLTIPRLAGYVK